MKKLIQKLFPQNKKPKAQSLVEFAIALPILLILLSGVVEFGFALNYYLSLMDATREAARYYSDSDPFDFDQDPLETPDEYFYPAVSGMVINNLDPSNNTPGYEGRRIPLDPAMDDVIVTVFAKDDSGVVSYPTSGAFHQYGNAASNFTTSEIASRFESSSPNAGLVLVEVVYNYRMVLKIPFITRFIPQTFPMRAYTFMPLSAAEPIAATPTP
jgi:hypothetical protein